MNVLCASDVPPPANCAECEYVYVLAFASQTPQIQQQINKWISYKYDTKAQPFL